MDLGDQASKEASSSLEGSAMFWSVVLVLVVPVLVVSAEPSAEVQQFDLSGYVELLPELDGKLKNKNPSSSYTIIMNNLADLLATRLEDQLDDCIYNVTQRVVYFYPSADNDVPSQVGQVVQRLLRRHFRGDAMARFLSDVSSDMVKEIVNMLDMIFTPYFVKW